MLYPAAHAAVALFLISPLGWLAFAPGANRFRAPAPPPPCCPAVSASGRPQAEFDRLVAMTEGAGQRLSDLLRQAGSQVPVAETSLFVAEQRKRLLTRIRANGQVPVTDEICMAELGPLIEEVGAAWPVASSVLCSDGNNDGKPFVVRFVREVLGRTQAAPRLQGLLLRDAFMEPYYFQIALRAQAAVAAGDPAANVGIAGAVPLGGMPPAPSVTSDDDLVSEAAADEPAHDDPYVDVRVAPTISDTGVEPTYFEVAQHYVDAGLGSKFAVAVSVGVAVIGGLMDMPVSGRALALGTTLLTSWRCGVRMTRKVKEHLSAAVSVAIAAVSVMNWWATLMALCVVVAGILLAIVVPGRWGRAPPTTPDDLVADGEETLFGTSGGQAAATRLPSALKPAGGGIAAGSRKVKATWKPGVAAAAPVQSSVVGAGSTPGWQTALGAVGSASGTGLLGGGAPCGYGGGVPSNPGGGAAYPGPSTIFGGPGAPPATGAGLPGIFGGAGGGWASGAHPPPLPPPAMGPGGPGGPGPPAGGPGGGGGGPWGGGGPPFGGGGGPPGGGPPPTGGGPGTPGGASSPYMPPTGGAPISPYPSPGGGGGGPGPPGAGSDPYTAPRWGSGLLPNHKRMATEIYWNLRSSTTSCREYFAIYYKGDRHGQEYRDLWTVCIGVDDKLELAYRHGGYPGVQYALATDDMLEHWLTRLGSQINYVRTGNSEMKIALQSSQAPGDCDIIPSWGLQGHRDTLKSEYQATQRQRGGGRGGGVTPGGSGAAGSEGSATPRRPRRRGTGPTGSASSTNPAGPSAAGGSGGGSTRPPGGRGQRG